MESLFDRLCKTGTLLQAWKTVRQKGASGGIDGISIKDIDDEIGDHIKILQTELKACEWKPEPYLRISIPKKDSERRKLGLLCVRDKIVQQAIRIVIEPRFERLFVKNSYGYRPDKGHTKAIKFVRHCCQNKKYPFVLRLDIDNYFDTINHDILFTRLRSVIPDEEILRLVKLCVQMGNVNKGCQWKENSQGIAQGSVLSPLLSNFYLHSFDQFILSKTPMYVRYADDFIICCESKEKAELLLKGGTEFLEKRLKLSLNPPVVSEIKDGFEFLGVCIDNRKVFISKEKEEKLICRIRELEWESNAFNDAGLKYLQGIKNYYAPLLPQSCLVMLDDVLISHLKQIITVKWKDIPNKTALQNALKDIDFYSEQNILHKSSVRGDLTAHYLAERSANINVENERKNKKVIRQKKKEYRKKENEATEIIINTYGTFIGVDAGGISLKVYGKKQTEIPPGNNLRHITVLGNGISISSNAIGYCMQNKIPIDFFTNTGQHYASILSNSFLSNSLWQKQAMMPQCVRALLAKRIIYGKLKNQKNLIKYFHKYHKTTSEELCAKYDVVLPKLESIINNVSQYKHQEYNDKDYHVAIIGWEAAGALLYWDYIKTLVSDDDVGFLYRERRGATDIVNSLLNYGYSILYSRIWQTVLQRKLNPMDSVIHLPQSGKPTFVYDIIELFRSQVVDRVVVSLVQKKEPLTIQNGRLSDKTKELLVRNIVERLNRYEVYRGRECRLCDIMKQQVGEIAGFISSGTNYKPYIAKW
ncbi:CRISPR-associated endonuclease Cas1 [Xylanibacter muris]|uniref:CRISPR-associated endonuclease Cas1 n=1 Tax=Xylanibacter muris TaxID=2736290 RepID=A0ABX2AR82_9BACT|nr:CRISPR-associated endonuclease Cas1 [Xylanibacter muris]NPD92740.1 CRISPR-associated endonuclease Cas1 [Xylanibacter muris]